MFSDKKPIEIESDNVQVAECLTIDLYQTLPNFKTHLHVIVSRRDMCSFQFTGSVNINCSFTFNSHIYKSYVLQLYAINSANSILFF